MRLRVHQLLNEVRFEKVQSFAIQVVFVRQLK